MRYALLVRGINVGGKNKVVMAQLRQELTELGLEKVETYINSGNIFFTSTAPKAQLVEKLEAFFERRYPFIQSLSAGFFGMDVTLLIKTIINKSVQTMLTR